LGSRLAARDSSLAVARAMDNWSRVLFPAVYALIVFTFWTN